MGFQLIFAVWAAREPKGLLWNDAKLGTAIPTGIGGGRKRVFTLVYAA
jgi:hypothetical protein